MHTACRNSRFICDCYFAVCNEKAEAACISQSVLVQSLEQIFISFPSHFQILYGSHHTCNKISRINPLSVYCGCQYRFQSNIFIKTLCNGCNCRRFIRNICWLLGLYTNAISQVGVNKMLKNMKRDEGHLDILIILMMFFILCFFLPPITINREIL